MRSTRTYIKQSPNGIVSHVYEHVVASHVLKALSAHGYQQLLDYEFSAKTFDGIVVLRIDTYSKRVLARFRTALDGAAISSRSVGVAVTQIACEYERLEKIDSKSLERFVKDLHATPWVRSENYTHSKRISTADARELFTSIGGFGAKSKKSFHQYEFTYTITHCPYELKPLAVYVLQIIGLNQIDHLSETIERCYDAGDTWAEYQDGVGYAHTVTTPRDVVLTQTELDASSAENLASFVTKKGVRKIATYIKRDQSAPFPYFSVESLFAKSYQVIGRRGFAQHLSHDSIRRILEMIEVSSIKIRS